MKSYLELEPDTTVRWDLEVLGGERVYTMFGKNVSSVWPVGGLWQF